MLSRKTLTIPSVDPTERVKFYSAVRTVGGRTFTEYTVAWRLDGQRKRRTFTDESEALTYKKQVEELLAAGFEAASRVTPDELAYVSLLKAEFPNVPAHEILRYYIETHEDHARRKDVPTVAVLAEELIRDREAKAKQDPRHRRNCQTLRSHLRRFAAIFRMQIDRVTVKELERYLDANFEAPKTRDNHRISILLLFNEARRLGHLPFNKPHAAQLVRAPKKGSLTRVRPREVYTPDELIRILAASDERMIPFVVLGAFAGPRAAERGRMTWSAWKADGSVSALVMEQDITKTARRRSIAVEGNLAEWLTAFRGGDNEPMLPLYNAHKFLAGILDKAGVARKHNALRVSYVSYHLEHYRDAALTAKHCGHSVQMLETEYLHLVSRSDAQKWFQITPRAVLEYAKENGLPAPLWAHRVPPETPRKDLLTRTLSFKSGEFGEGFGDFAE